MPRTPKNPIIVATFDGRTIGWSGGENGCRLIGDEEWMSVARAASAVGLEFTLYEDIDLKADLDDMNNPAGAFAAMAWYAKERIRVKQAPEGMMEELGLLMEPEMVGDNESSVPVALDGNPHDVPLKTLGTADSSKLLKAVVADLELAPGKDI